jgi:hypothetical protein
MCVLLDIVQLGPSPFQKPKARFGPKRNTKLGFNTHHSPHKFLGQFQGKWGEEKRKVVKIMT